MSRSPVPITARARAAVRTTAPVALALALVLTACDRPEPTASVESAGPLAPVSTEADSSSEDYIAPLPVLLDDEGYYVSGQVIARFTPGGNAAQVAAAAGGSVKRQMLLARTFILNVPAGHEAAVVRALSRNPNIEFAELDRVMVVTPCEVGNCTLPTDGFLGYKWDLHNPGFIRPGATVLQATAAADADIDWLEAFDFLGGSAFTGSAVVGIIDTGIYPDHQDLTGRVIAARNFASGYPSTLIKDRNTHGTHVAGIAAGRGDNTVGVSGVAYGANIKLINAKACDLYLSNGQIVTSCASSSTADAIVWATDQGANVLNLSLGGDPAATSGSAAQQQALQYARSRNVLPFCATGNNNYPGVSFPARFPECVAVGATSWGDTRASYSNYGAEIDLSAPGGDGNAANTPYSLVLSTDTVANRYTWKAGTSMATPQAVGLAALLYATGLTNADAVLARLQSTADDLGAAGADPQFGAGRINAYRAVANVDPNAPPVARINGPYAGTEGAAVAFSGAGSVDPNGKPITYAWNFGDGSTGTGASPTHTYADNGSYTVTLTVTDESNRQGTATATATVTNATPVTTMSLSSATIFSGQSVTASGSFSDAGVNDGPWAYAFDWADGTSATGSTAAQGVLGATRTYFKAGTYAVQAKVTDKDAAAGTSAAVTLTVNRVPVGIDIRPGSNVNPIYWKQPESAKIPVAILGSATLDVRTVVAASVQLGDMRVAPKKTGGVMASYEDVNGDGRVDLVLQFERQSMSQQGTLSTSTTALELFADLASGVQLVGTDVVRVIQ